MKRGGPPKRGKPLQANAGKVREFLARGRQNATLSRTGAGLGRSSPERKGKPAKPPSEPVGPLTPSEWRFQVWLADRGVCVACEAGPFRPDDSSWVWQAHHPLPKQKLPPALKYDERNGVVLCRRCHERHESRTETISGDVIPARCWQFALEVGSWAVIALERAHPTEEG